MLNFEYSICYISIKKKKTIKIKANLAKYLNLLIIFGSLLKLSKKEKLLTSADSNKWGVEME